MAAPTRTPRSQWIEHGLKALAAGGPNAVRIEPIARVIERVERKGGDAMSKARRAGGLTFSGELLGDDRLP